MLNRVIDFHVHIFTEEQYLPATRDYMEGLNPAQYRRRLDIIAHPEKLVAFLREQGISYAVILAEHAPVTTGHVPSEYVAAYCQGHAMLIPFASVNPNTDQEPAARLRHYVEGLGMRGLKLLPSYQQFYPNSSAIYPVYAEAERLGIPVLFHTGSSRFTGTRMKYSDPLHLDDVAVDFPKLTIVMAHSGRGFFYQSAFFLARHHSNVYMEVAGLPPHRLLDYFPEFERNADKIVFGSDWPAIPSTTIRENVEAFCSLPLSPSTIEKVLYRNAERILFGS